MAKASRAGSCFGSLIGMKASFDTDREWATERARYRVAPARSPEEKLVGVDARWRGRALPVC